MDKQKLTWIDWLYYTSCLGLMCYTVYVVYTLKEDDNVGRLRALRVVRSVCEGTAKTVGKWGMKAEVAYHRIIESERMN